MRIHNLEQLAGHMGVDPEYPGQLDYAIERAVYRATECGCWFEGCEIGVRFGGYAEGSEEWLPVHELMFPFDSEQFDWELELADAEGSEAWLRANVPPMECPACSELSLYTVAEDHGRDMECEACGHFEIHA